MKVHGEHSLINFKEVDGCLDKIMLGYISLRSKLNSTEQKCGTTDKEALAIVQFFHLYFTGYFPINDSAPLETEELHQGPLS